MNGDVGGGGGGRAYQRGDGEGKGEGGELLKTAQSGLGGPLFIKKELVYWSQLDCP